MNCAVGRILEDKAVDLMAIKEKEVSPEIKLREFLVKFSDILIKYADIVRPSIPYIYYKAKWNKRIRYFQ